jgi:hypothetical protein
MTSDERGDKIDTHIRNPEVRVAVSCEGDPAPTRLELLLERDDCPGTWDTPPPHQSYHPSLALLYI